MHQRNPMFGKFQPYSKPRIQYTMIKMKRKRCNICHGLNWDDIVECIHIHADRIYWKEFDIPIASLNKGILDRCKTCAVIFQADTEAEGPISQNTRFNVKVPQLSGPVRVTRLFPEEKQGNCFELFTLPGDDIDPVYNCFGVSKSLPIPQDLFSDKPMAQAKKWLDECLSSHKPCKTIVERTLPTRVLHIGVEGGTIFLLERLQTESMNPHTARYVTLSHCWGRTPLMTTTTNTLKERKAGISYSALPKTFRDAVFVSRKMGFQYLWIDSLCILQDSKEDWAVEAASMHNVYANATLNISADAAIDSSMGLTPGPRFPAGVEVPEGSSSRVFTRPIYEMDNLYGTVDPGNQIAHSVLYPNDNILDILPTRGWVLQEYMLSPRILHFSMNEMAWECDTHSICECSAQPREYLPRSIRSLRLNPRDPRGQEAENWQKLIGEYSYKNLTFNTDRLAAINGLANRIASITGRTYINGLWEEDLPICLAWSRRWFESVPGSSRIPDQPSWSWTSVVAPISLATRTIKPSSVDGLLPDFHNETLNRIFRTATPQIKAYILPHATKYEVHNSLLTPILLVTGFLSTVRIINDNIYQVSLSNIESKSHGRHGEYGGQYTTLDLIDNSEIDNTNCFLLVVGPINDEGLYCLILRRASSMFELDDPRECYQRIGWHRYNPDDIFIFDADARHNECRLDKAKFLEGFREVEIILV